MTDERPRSPTPTEPRPLPTKLVRNLSIGLVAVIAVVGLILVLIPRSSDDDVTVTNNPAVEGLIPARGDEVLQQTDVAIDLAAGYDGTMSINGIAIPADQLVRTEVVNRLSFRPDAGKVIEALEPDRNCATAVYWPESEPTDTGTITWCFTAA